MKITEVRFHHLRYPVTEKYGNSFTWNTERSCTLVEILTDAGITGWGQGTGPLNASLVENQVVGRDPFEVEVIWDALNGGRKQGNAGLTSGVNIALWDIMGKALEVPVYRLLGGAFRDRIPCYASGLFRKDSLDNTQRLANEARGYVDQGFTAMKMKTGLGKVYDVANVAAVREAIEDDILLVVDATPSPMILARRSRSGVSSMNTIWRGMKSPYPGMMWPGIWKPRSRSVCGSPTAKACRGDGRSGNLSSSALWISFSRTSRLSADLRGPEKLWRWPAPITLD